MIEPRDIPMLYQGAMVQAIFRGDKRQTRRGMKPQPDQVLHGEPYWNVGGYRAWGYRKPCHATLRRGGNPLPCPYGQRGDLIWVRETYFAWGRWETRSNATKGRDEWHFIDMTVDAGKAYHHAVADPLAPAIAPGPRGGVLPAWWKRPAIFMPRAACRITLRVEDVRVERLQDISEADAIAEGLTQTKDGAWLPGPCAHPEWAYHQLWDQINGDGAWASDPWVWVVSFIPVLNPSAL